MSLEIKVFIPCKNGGCTNDTKSYIVYNAKGERINFVDYADDAPLADGKILDVCSMACKELAIQHSKEMAQ